MYSNGLITAPVSVWDVRRALGLNSTDVGTLCTSTRINIWAKYKPVRLNKLDTTDQFDFSNNKWKSTASWMHGSGDGVHATNSYGLACSSYGNVNSIKTPYDSSDVMNGWVYNRPQGGLAAPYRLQDFAGYYHNAATFGDTFNCNDPIIYSQKARIIATFRYSPDDEHAVTIENLLGGAKYFGILVTTSSGTYVGHATNSTAGTPTVNVEVAASYLTSGQTYKVYPFLSDNPVTWGATETTNRYYTVPLLKPTTMTPKSSEDWHGGLNTSAAYFMVRDLEGGWVEDPRYIIVTTTNNDSSSWIVRYVVYKGTAPSSGDPESSPVTIAASGGTNKQTITVPQEQFPYSKVRVYYRRNTLQTEYSFDVTIKRNS